MSKEENQTDDNLIKAILGTDIVEEAQKRYEAACRQIYRETIVDEFKNNAQLKGRSVKRSLNREFKKIEVFSNNFAEGLGIKTSNKDKLQDTLKNIELSEEVNQAIDKGKQELKKFWNASWSQKYKILKARFNLFRVSIGMVKTKDIVKREVKEIMKSHESTSKYQKSQRLEKNGEKENIIGETVSEFNERSKKKPSFFARLFIRGKGGKGGRGGRE